MAAMDSVRIGRLALLASGAIAAGGGAWLAKEKLFGGGIKSLRGQCASNPLPASSSDAAAKRIPAVAERFRRIWPELTGQKEMPPAALEIALAQAWLESGIAEAGGGGWWRDKTGEGQGNMVGSGNLGARQCGVGDDGGDYYTCVPYGDSMPMPDGTQKKFDAKFRYYKAGTVGGKQRTAGDAAAYDFLYSLVKQWPALTELQSGDVLAYAMKQGPKYRAGDPPGQKVYGREYSGGNGYYGGFGATMEERVGGYGRAIASHLPAIAAALGHKKIYACIAPELLSGKGKSHAAVSGPCCGEAEEPGDVAGCCAAPEVSYPEEDMDVLEGVGATVAVAFASAIAAALVGAIAADALKSHSEKKATEVIEAIRKVGIDYLDPGARPRAGWKVVQSNDQQLLKALEFLGSKRDSVLRNLASKGFRFQAKVRLNIPAAMVKAAQQRAPASASPNTAEIERLRADISARFKSYTPAQVEQAVKDHLAATGPAAAQAAANWTPAAQAALDACVKRGGDLISCSQDKAVIAATLATPHKIPELAQDREPIRQPENIEYVAATEEEAQRRTFQGADVTVEGVGKTVAIAAGLTVAAGLVAMKDFQNNFLTEKSKQKTLTESAIEVGKDIAMLPVNIVRTAPAIADTAIRLPANVARAAVVSGEADVTPEAAAASDAHAVANPSVEGAATAAAVVAGGLAAGVLAAVALTRPKEDAPAPGAASSPMGPAVTRPKASDASPAAPRPVGPDRGKVAATKAAHSAVQKAESEMSALYARGDATEAEIQDKLEDIEKLKAKTTAAKYGIPLYGSESVGESVNALWLAGALPRARAIPGSGGALVWYLEPPPSLGAAKKGEDEPDDVDKALATSSDISDIAESALKAFSSAKKIAQRGATIEDPKCRKLIKQWVEKHPILARFTTPDLRTLEGSLSIPLFAERYADTLSTMRAASGYAGESCEPTKAEHLAVMAELGLSRQEEDAIYTAASRTAATALDLYAPGAGQSAQQAADTISSLITGRKMAPGTAAMPAKEPARPDALRKAQAEAQKAKTEKANVVRTVKEFVRSHPIITKFFNPDLSAISGFRRTR